MKRTEHRLLGHSCSTAMALRYHELRKPESVGQKHEFLADLVAHLARFRQVFDASEPLGFGQLHFSREVMEVLNQASHNLMKPRVRRVGYSTMHLGGDVVLVKVTHVRQPRVALRRPDADPRTVQ